MRITYVNITTNGATGGGGGQIVVGTIPVGTGEANSVNPGEELKVIVGAGGAGGASGSAGSAGGVTKITRKNGTVLLSTAGGSTGGNPDGTTVGQAGHITNGLNSTQITKSGYSSTAGSAANGQSGGAGGRTVLNNVENHCSPGGGGSENTAGGNAIGVGGCGGGGGGGGGSGAAGGSGSIGYALIKYGGESS